MNMQGRREFCYGSSLIPFCSMHLRISYSHRGSTISGLNTFKTLGFFGFYNTCVDFRLRYAFEVELLGQTRFTMRDVSSLSNE